MEGITLTHKGFDTRVGSRFDARLAAELNRLTTQTAVAVVRSAAVVQIARESGTADSAAALSHARPGTVGSLRHSQVVRSRAKMRGVRQQPVVIRPVSFSVPSAHPETRRIDLAITPARPLKFRYFAGGRNWHETQTTEE